MWASLPRESRLWFTWWRGPKTRAPSAPEHPTFTVNMVMFIFRIQKWFPKKADNPGESMRKSHPPKYCSGSCNSQQILCFWGAICPNLWERVVEMGKTMTRPLKSPKKTRSPALLDMWDGKKKIVQRLQNGMVYFCSRLPPVLCKSCPIQMDSGSLIWNGLFYYYLSKSIRTKQS